MVSISEVWTAGGALIVTGGDVGGSRGSVVAFGAFGGANNFSLRNLYLYQRRKRLMFIPIDFHAYSSSVRRFAYFLIYIALEIRLLHIQLGHFVRLQTVCLGISVHGYMA